jgi:ribokinase
MFGKQIDFLAIGDITTDAFIRLKDAHINCKVNSSECEICMKFADKVPFESVEEIAGVGNSPNAAVSASRLGLNSALICHIGNDENGKNCVKALKKNKVLTDHVVTEKGVKTNYHYVLWYGDERTILVKHEDRKYTLPHFNEPKWIYLSSIGGNSIVYHTHIADYLRRHPKVKFAFQPGTFQMKAGLDAMRYFYERSDVFICNVEEAQRILNIEAGVNELLEKMKALGPKMVWITDGPKGAYFYDGTRKWFMPIYPDPKAPMERTGCGDAFASTFVSALALGKSVEEASLWAPINPMSVVQDVGAQKGLLSRQKLEKLLTEKPADYELKNI